MGKAIKAYTVALELYDEGFRAGDCGRIMDKLECGIGMAILVCDLLETLESEGD